MKRIFTLVCCILLCLGLFSACTGGGVNGGGSNRLVIWSVEGPVFPGYENNTKDKDAPTTKLIVDKFHEEYPNVEIKIEKHGWGVDLHSALRDAYSINKQPDIVVGEMFIQSEIELGYFLPLDIPKEYLDNVRPELFAQSRGKDGKYYGVPVSTGIPMLLYNETLLRESLGYQANIESQYFKADGSFKYPTSVTELKDIALKVKNYYVAKDDLTKGGFMVNNAEPESSGFRGQYFMSMFGGGWFDENDELALTSQENEKAFTYLREISKAAAFGNVGMTKEDEITNSFLSGNVAMAVEHPAILADYPKNDIKTAPIPTVDGIESNNVLVGSVSYMLTKQTRNEKAARAFLNVLLDKEVQTTLYTNSSCRLPVRKDVAIELLSSQDEAVLKRHEIMRPALEAIIADNIVPGVPSFTESYTQIWQYWANFNNKVYNSDQDIKSLLKEFEDSVRAKL